MTEVTRLVAAENDYRDAASRPKGRDVTVGVVIPAYNRIDRLEATLAGLAHQTSPADTVVVADDGSDPPLADVVATWQDRLPITSVRREDEGFGAGQARDLGAASCHADVLLFIDSDCIADPHLVERHRQWHERAAGLVVVGNRYHVPGDEVDRSAIGADFGSVRSLAVNVPEDGAPDDWRRLFYRRNRTLQIGDGAYRAVVSSNLSIERDVFLRIGGFPDGFTAWGGEDTELGWRAWNDGAFIVVDNDAIVYHQLEPGEDRSARMASLHANRLLMADRIPNRFYRTTPGSVYSVPQSSVVITVASPEERDSAIADALRATYDDIEILVGGPDDALEPVARVHDNAWLRPTPDDLTETISCTRGEFVVFADGRIHVDRRLVARATRAFRVDPRIGAVRVAYAVDGSGTYRRLGDLAAIDARNGDGRPLFAVVRRRELMKEIHAHGAVDWTRLWNRIRIELLLNDTITAAASDLDLPPRGVLPVGPAEIRRAGAEESARTVVRAWRSRRESPPAPPAAADDVHPAMPVRYIGWTGQDNFGDEALLEAVQGLMPWASVDPAETNPRLLMLGGGTLINSDGTYLRRIEQLDSPRLDRVIFGSGVRDPEFWDVTEPLERWFPIFDASLGVWLRGPRSEQTLRDAGYTGKLDVIGDPALAIARPDDVERREGRVVISALDTGGACWGGDDRAVVSALAGVVAHLVGEGQDVALLSAHPKDDRVAIDVMRAAGHPGLEMIPAYRGVDVGVAAIAEAALVIAERLHATVLAAATGTPFVAIEYRPKVRDFAESVGAGEWVLRTDELRPDVLVERAGDVLADRSRQQTVADAVEGFRSRLRTVSEELHDALEG